MLRAIVLNRADNVGTLIDPGRAGETCALQGEANGEVRLLQDVPFGHKVCVARDARRRRRAQVRAGHRQGLAAIKVGEHAHVHNIESARGRGDQASR